MLIKHKQSDDDQFRNYCTPKYRFGAYMFYIKCNQKDAENNTVEKRTEHVNRFNQTTHAVRKLGDDNAKDTPA